ncbi:transmembrane protein, partial [Cystoisospora suis]
MQEPEEVSREGFFFLDDSDVESDRTGEKERIHGVVSHEGYASQHFPAVEVSPHTLLDLFRVDEERRRDEEKEKKDINCKPALPPGEIQTSTKEGQGQREPHAEEGKREEFLPRPSVSETDGEEQHAGDETEEKEGTQQGQARETKGIFLMASTEDGANLCVSDWDVSKGNRLNSISTHGDPRGASPSDPQPACSSHCLSSDVEEIQSNLLPLSDPSPSHPHLPSLSLVRELDNVFSSSSNSRLSAASSSSSCLVPTSSPTGVDSSQMIEEASHHCEAPAVLSDTPLFSHSPSERKEVRPTHTDGPPSDHVSEGETEGGEHQEKRTKPDGASAKEGSCMVECLGGSALRERAEEETEEEEEKERIIESKEDKEEKKESTVEAGEEEEVKTENSIQRKEGERHQTCAFGDLGESLTSERDEESTPSERRPAEGLIGLREENPRADDRERTEGGDDGTRASEGEDLKEEGKIGIEPATDTAARPIVETLHEERTEERESEGTDIRSREETVIGKEHNGRTDCEASRGDESEEDSRRVEGEKVNETEGREKVKGLIRAEALRQQTPHMSSASSCLSSSPVHDAPVPPASSSDAVLRAAAAAIVCKGEKEEEVASRMTSRTLETTYPPSGHPSRHPPAAVGLKGRRRETGHAKREGVDLEETDSNRVRRDVQKKSIDLLLASPSSEASPSEASSGQPTPSMYVRLQRQIQQQEAHAKRLQKEVEDRSKELERIQQEYREVQERLREEEEKHWASVTEARTLKDTLKLAEQEKTRTYEETERVRRC